MKIKRWLSLLLALALCAGLLPGTTLATGESERPEGYEQMYVEDNGSYVTVAEGTAGSGGDILFYIKTGDNYVALNETQQSEDAYVYTDGNLAVTCDSSLGETGPGRSGTNWRKQETKPGASGYLYAVSGQSKYAIEAKITGNPNVIYDDKGNSEFTMNAGMEQAFTFSPIVYVDGESTRLVAADYNGETYTFTTTVGSLYWHESFNELAISTAGITSDATGIITITNKNDSTKVYTCEVTVKGTSSGDNEGGNTSPADSGVLYDDKGASEFTMVAGSKYGFPPHIDVDGTKTAITPGDGYEFSCDTQVGTVVWDGTTGGGELSWSVADVSSAVSGKIYATHTESGKVYSCTVNVSVPEEDVDEENTITINGEEYAQMYYKSVAGDYVTKIEVDLNGSVSLKENLFANQSGTTAIDVANVSLVGDNLGELVSPPAPEAWDTNNNAIAGASGYLCAVNGEQRYAIAVSIKAAEGETGGGEGGESGDTSDERPFKLYDAETGGNEIVADSDNNYTVQVTGSNGKTVYFRMNEGSDLSFGEGCSAQYNEVVPDGPPGGLEIISGTLVNETTFSIKFKEDFNEARTAPVTLIAGGKTYSFSITFAVQDGYTLVSDSRPLTENDKVEEPIEESKWGPAAIEYDGDGDGMPETYYICAMSPKANDTDSYNMSIAMGSRYGTYDESAIFSRSFCMGVWTYNEAGDSYSLVSGLAKARLMQAFGSSWSVRAYNKAAADEVSAENYPAIYSWRDANGWPFGVQLRFGAHDIGAWYYEFSGTIDGQTVATYVADEFSFASGSMEYTASSVNDVNDKLQEWAKANHPQGMQYAINLSAGEHEGIIGLPFGMGVTINGSTSDERTVLHGGIGGNGGVTVKNIDFEGCGWWKTNWPDNEKFGGEPNYALYTGGGARYEGCTFKNYYHALHCHGGMMFGGSNTVFENNLIALYMNSGGNGGGNLTMEENTFRHNGCAFWLENFGNMFPLNSYHVLRCKFYDNGWDMINLLGKCYFLPGQLFVRGGEYGHGKFAGRRDALRQIPVNNVPEKASGIAADVSQDGCGVYTFPVAKNDRFDDYDYSNANAVIGNHHAASWKIPENNLNGKTITVIQDEKGEDAVVWSFGN